MGLSAVECTQMRLAVLGHSTQAIVAAAWASMAANGAVTLVGDFASNEPLPTTAVYHQNVTPCRIDRVQAGDPIDADAFIVVAPRDEALALTRQYSAAMRNRPCAYAPGGFGLLQAVSELLDIRDDDPISLCQLPGFPVTGSVEGTRVTVRAVKRQFPVGPLDERLGEAICSVFRRWFPDLVQSTLSVTTLSNTNNLLHPPILMLNAVRSETGQPYHFYRDGVSPAVSRVIHAVDDERTAVLKRLGQDTPASLVQWFTLFYEDFSLTGETIGELVTALPTFAAVPGPTTLDHRFVTEDVTYGLAPIEALAHRVGVETPVLTSLVTTLSVVCGADLRARADDLVDVSGLTALG